MFVWTGRTDLRSGGEHRFGSFPTLTLVGPASAQAIPVLVSFPRFHGHLPSVE